MCKGMANLWIFYIKIGKITIVLKIINTTFIQNELSYVLVLTLLSFRLYWDITICLIYFSKTNPFLRRESSLHVKGFSHPIFLDQVISKSKNIYIVVITKNTQQSRQTSLDMRGYILPGFIPSCQVNISASLHQQESFRDFFLQCISAGYQG